MHPDEVGIAWRVVEAAARAGAARLVYHSVLHPHDCGMPHHLRKADAEEVIRSAGLPWTVLQPAPYQQNLLAAALDGRIAVPYALDVPFTPVDLDDVAEVAARVLTEPGHERATYELAGPERLDVATLAAQAGEVLGHEVVAEVTDAGRLGGRTGCLDAGRGARRPAGDVRQLRRRGLAGNPRVLLAPRPSAGTWRDLLARSRRSAG